MTESDRSLLGNAESIAAADRHFPIPKNASSARVPKAFRILITS
jgi:hypothetical protein